MKDFPESRLPNGLDVVSPAEFAANTAALNPLLARDAVVAIVERSGRKGPRVAIEDVLDTLVNRYKMTHAVELVRQAL